VKPKLGCILLSLGLWALLASCQAPLTKPRQQPHATIAPQPTTLEPFSGNWVTSEGGNLSLDLGQKGSRLSGYHAAIVGSGRRIDAVMQGEGSPSISGTIDGTVAHVVFRSGYGDGKGEATLTLRGGALTWQITRSSGIHYLPPHCVLQREKKD
jgi:hypothetical protein